MLTSNTKSSLLFALFFAVLTGCGSANQDSDSLLSQSAFLQSPTLAASPSSPGCAIPHEDTGLQQATIPVGNTQRSFLRVVHPTYNPNKAHALVIGYHGLGLDGNSPRVHHKWPLIEEMAADDAIFIYPHARDGRWTANSNSSPDVLFFDQLVKHLSENFCIDKSRIFVHGFSNGAFFVNNLASYRSQEIRALIAVAGGGGGSPLPAMIIHGSSDSNVSYSYGQQSLAAYARANACKLPLDASKFTWNSCQPIEGCISTRPLHFCPWQGNHHWPEFTLSSVWKFIASFPSKDG